MFRKVEVRTRKYKKDFGDLWGEKSSKASGMKRFKRLDTISEEFTRDNLATLIKYKDAQGVKPKTYTFNPIYVKRSKLSPYRKSIMRECIGSV